MEAMRDSMRVMRWSGARFVGCVFVIEDKIIRLTEFVKKNGWCLVTILCSFNSPD